PVREFENNEENVYDEGEEDKQRFSEATDPGGQTFSNSAAVIKATSTENEIAEGSIAKVQASLFDEIGLEEKSLENVPRQKQRSPNYRPIKVSHKLQMEINEKKISIGLLGELAVIESETQRLITENTLHQVEHTSLVNDSAGYDI